MIFCDKKEGAEPSLFFVCNAKRRQSHAFVRKEVIGSVERPLTDNCLYDYFGSGSERK